MPITKSIQDKEEKHNAGLRHHPGLNKLGPPSMDRKQWRRIGCAAFSQFIQMFHHERQIDETISTSRAPAKETLN